MTIQGVNMNQDDLASTAEAHWRNVIRRRSFLKGVGIATAMLPAGALLATGVKAGVQAAGRYAVSRLTGGDVAILQFLAAAEIIETDLWQQYNELGGVNGGNPAYIAAPQNLDGDMPQDITDNNDDEVSHSAFLHSYLTPRGAEPVDH